MLVIVGELLSADSTDHVLRSWLWFLYHWRPLLLLRQFSFLLLNILNVLFVEEFLVLFRKLSLSLELED